MNKYYPNDFRVEPCVTIHDSKMLWPIRITIIDITIGDWKYPVEWWQLNNYDIMKTMDPRLPAFWKFMKYLVISYLNVLNFHVNNRHRDG
jgi:hypothetical protein